MYKGWVAATEHERGAGSRVTIPLVIVGPDLRIRRFSGMAERVLNVVASDIGRSILAIRPKMNLTELGTIDNRIDGAVVAFIDIDDRRRLEAEVRSRSDELERVNKIKNEFLAVLSHELRTPLTAVLGWTRSLRAGHLDAKQTTHAVEVVERNVVWQGRLIEDLGLFPSAPSPRPPSILCDRPPTPRRSARIRTRVRPRGGCGRFGPPPTTNPRESLDQRAQVHARRRPYRGASRTGRLGAEARGSGFGGRASPPSYYPVCLSVSARPKSRSRDSTFVVSLPAAPTGTEIAPADQEPQRVSAYPSLAGIRVLVVEDHDDAREFIAVAPERCDASVTTATSVESALAAFERVTELAQRT